MYWRQKQAIADIMDNSSKYAPFKTFRIRKEEWEREYLSPRAMKASESKGRVRFEEPCPIRTDFQRDRDRILHSKSFRRLKHKTQVFIAPKGDHYRTRLTHTLEVSAIARTLASVLRLNEDLTESISLGHDLGHSPFGHAGEKYLNEIMRENGFDPGFLHSEHSVRIVEELENDGKGLNLTRETIDGIKHHTKGMDDIKQSISDGELPSTEEGRLVKISDRIAYLSADLEDAIRAELIKANDIPVLFHDELRDQPSGVLGHLVREIAEYSERAGWVSLSNETISFMDDLKDFLLARVYEHPVVLEREPQIRMLIYSLFERFAGNEGLYENYVKTSYDNEMMRLRNVCDYIAGMTDVFAVHIFEQLFIPKTWEHF